MVVQSTANVRHVRINYSTKVGTRHGQWVSYVVTATVTATIRRYHVQT
jgi:hypothetical protein